MYRFNERTLECRQVAGEFKYNPCIGSMYAVAHLMFGFWHLNTTHVSVQLSCDTYYC